MHKAQNERLVAIYAEFVKQAQHNEAAQIRQDAALAWQTCCRELSAACDRQGLDWAYELAVIQHGCRSKRRKVRQGALESLEIIFEIVAEEDLEFASLLERYDELEASVARLDEQQSLERRSIGLSAPRNFPDTIIPDF